MTLVIQLLWFKNIYRYISDRQILKPKTNMATVNLHISTLDYDLYRTTTCPTHVLLVSGCDGACEYALTGKDMLIFYN